MKKSLLLASLLAVALASTTGCVDKNKRQNDVNNYRVFLYNASGDVIKQWTSDGKVEYVSGRFSFTDKESGKKIMVAGTVIVEGIVAS